MARHDEGGVRRAERGFSLVEVLIVVFIVGVIAAISTISVSNTLKKGRLEQAGESVRGILGAARSQAAMNQCFVFVALGPTNSNLPKRLEVIVDTNRNLVPDDGVAQPLAQNQFTAGPGSRNEDITFSTLAVDQVETNWMAYVGPRGGISSPYDGGEFDMIAVDPMGKTYTPDGAMVSAVQTITISHRDMVEGSLRPRQSRVISVSPLFSVAVGRH